MLSEDAVEAGAVYHGKIFPPIHEFERDLFRKKTPQFVGVSLEVGEIENGYLPLPCSDDGRRDCIGNCSHFALETLSDGRLAAWMNWLSYICWLCSFRGNAAAGGQNDAEEKDQSLSSHGGR